MARLSSGHTDIEKAVKWEVPLVWHPFQPNGEWLSHPSGCGGTHTHATDRTVNFGLLTVAFRLWHLDCGLWTIDCILWSMYYRLWNLGCLPWTVDWELWTLDCENWTMDCGHGLPTVHFGLWTLNYGLYTLEYTLWTENCWLCWKLNYRLLILINDVLNCSMVCIEQFFNNIF